MTETDPPPVSKYVGPCRFGRLGAWITAHCPREFDTLLMEAGAGWEPGGRRWLLRLHRLGPALRALRQRTDPVFRQACVDLDAQ